MAADGVKKSGLRVAVTGATGDLGERLLPVLLADPTIAEVVTLGVAKPKDAPRLHFQHVDLTHHDADRALAVALEAHPVDALFHLAFVWGRQTPGTLAHELEVAGTMRVLEAVQRAKIPRLIVGSLTALYGAFPDHPARLTEDAALRGCPPSRFISDKVQAEQLLQRFTEQHPEVRTLILRFAPVVGPRTNNPISRLLRRRRIPTLLGFDPLWQAIHEDDAAAALHLALRAEARGVFNIVGEGVVPLSGLIQAAGGQAVPLPVPLARATMQLLSVYGGVGVPSRMLDYMHFAWVADGSRAKEALGFVPRHHARDAVAAMRRS